MIATCKYENNIKVCLQQKSEKVKGAAKNRINKSLQGQSAATLKSMPSTR